MKNLELSRIFEQIVKLLKIKGENPFKIRAYEKISLVLENLPIDIETIYQQGGLNNIPGVGEGITKKIEEFLTTGKLEYYEKLKETIPSGVIELLDISEVGPKTAKLLYEQLEVDSIGKLEKAVKEHRIKELPGMGKKSETNILRGIELYKRRKERFLLGLVLPLAEEIVEKLSQLKETDKINFAGSLRRKRETIGDIDILVTSQKPGKIMKTFTERIAKKYPIIKGGYVIGPFILAGELMGVHDITTKVMLEPELVFEFVNFSLEIISEYANALFDAGADIIAVLEPLTVILSSKKYKEFSLHPFKKLVSNLYNRPLIC